MPPPQREPDLDLLTLVDCRRVSGFSREKLRVAVASRVLPATRVGTSWIVRRSDLEIFVESQRQRPERVAS
jgi:hypothetical protein